MYEGLQVRNTNHLVAIKQMKFSNITNRYFLFVLADSGCLAGKLTGDAAPFVSTKTTLLACQRIEPS